MNAPRATATEHLTFNGMDVGDKQASISSLLRLAAEAVTEAQAVRNYRGGIETLTIEQSKFDSPFMQPFAPGWKRITISVDVFFKP